MLVIFSKTGKHEKKTKNKTKQKKPAILKRKRAH